MPKVAKKLKPVLGSRQRAQQRGQQHPACKAKPAKQHKRSLPPSSDHQQPFKKRAVALTSSQADKHWQCSSVIDQQSAEVVDKLLLAAETRRGGATIKSLTLAPHIVHKKPTFAVTCETLKHLPLLKQLVADAGFLDQHQQQLTPAAAYVLVYEMLFGQGFRRKGPAEKAVLQHKEKLQSGLQRALQEAGVKDVAAWLTAHQQQQQQQSQQQQPMVQHPRFARVNTLKASVQQVLAQLRNSNGSSSRFEGVKVDDLLPDLLVFPAGTDLHDHPLVTEGVLILQSKASCMPAHALQPQPGWHVVDCCAAPGNKTTHVAALLHANTAAAAAAAAAGAPVLNGVPRSKHSSKKARSQQAGDSSQQQGLAAAVPQGLADANISGIRVYAFDKDPKRLKRLAANIDRAGAGSIVVPERADFLTIDPLDPKFKQVKGVILDPSCSGSGTTVSRMDHLLPGSAAAAAADGLMDEQEQQRVEQLAKFQEAALLHALQFPALQRLVYSTCSIHQRENEDVVAAVLPAATAAGFRLVDPFPAWHRRGVPVVEGSELLVRTDAHEDGTDGFFVAVFERSTSSVAPQKPQGQHQEEQQQQQQQREQGHESEVLADVKHDEQKQKKRKKKDRLQQQEEQQQQLQQQRQKP